MNWMWIQPQRSRRWRKTSGGRRWRHSGWPKSTWPTPWAKCGRYYKSDAIARSHEGKRSGMRIFIVMLMVGLMAGCGQRQADTFSGTLEMTEHQLGAKAAGRVATLGVEEGSYVK